MLSIENLQGRLRARSRAADFSLCVEAGQVAAVIGPNGCGKSTMLRCVSGLMRPQAGRVLVAGHDVTTLSGRERARQIALLPQSFAGELWNDLDVEEVVLAGRTPFMPPYGAPSRTDLEKVDGALQAVDAWDLRGRSVNELSAASGNASVWRALWRRNHAFSCWMSRLQISMCATSTRFWISCCDWRAVKT
jgi:iron complex transport system ATP-binding protein